MTRPTIEEVRAEPAGRRLNAWVECLVFGNELYRSRTSDYWLVQTIDAKNHRPVRVFSADPAACAELRRHLWASGLWLGKMGYGLNRVVVELFGHDEHPDVPITETPYFVPRTAHAEPIGTDPIAAECVAWCKVALLASLNETAPALTGAE
jgi:hypothetical protein